MQVINKQGKVQWPRSGLCSKDTISQEASNEITNNNSDATLAINEWSCLLDQSGSTL